MLGRRGEEDGLMRRLQSLYAQHEAEFEMGRTEVQGDDLTPEYRRHVRIRYAQKDVQTDTMVRFEICDPGTNPTTEDDFTVIGASQMTLAHLHFDGQHVPLKGHPELISIMMLTL